ncbi:MAG TPA: hypothetical protein VNJ29_02395 [Candidatus Nitrosotenuis sp.]|jgi:hypothetical protein|nr:hypothetical protein [Candidatus Nitrosotenuis sp.]
MYFVYEDLADLFQKKSLSALSEGKKDLANYLKTQATTYLKKAHAGMKVYFPETSAHLKRIQSKFDSLQ